MWLHGFLGLLPRVARPREINAFAIWRWSQFREASVTGGGGFGRAPFLDYTLTFALQLRKTTKTLSQNKRTLHAIVLSDLAALTGLLIYTRPCLESKGTLISPPCLP